MYLFTEQLIFQTFEKVKLKLFESEITSYSFLSFTLRQIWNFSLIMILNFKSNLKCYRQIYLLSILLTIMLHIPPTIWWKFYYSFIRAIMRAWCELKLMMRNVKLYVRVDRRKRGRKTETSQTSTTSCCC